MTAPLGNDVYGDASVEQHGLVSSPQPMEVEAEAEHLLGPAAKLFGKGAIPAWRGQVHIGHLHRVREYQRVLRELDEAQVHVCAPRDASDKAPGLLALGNQQGQQVVVYGDCALVICLLRSLEPYAEFLRRLDCPFDAQRLGVNVEVRPAQGEDFIATRASECGNADKLVEHRTPVEEPPIDIYTEALTRTNVGANPVWMTFTPLLGVSSVVKRFLHEKSDDRYKVVMTIEDVGHYTDDEKKTIIASYPQHELEARTKGIPILGSGRIFPIPEETLRCKHRDFPPHWPRIGGMDFGWDHPFAAVEVVWDRDTDTVYVSRCHRLREATPILHAAALREWGRELPWAWPRDGRRETLEGAGIALAQQYKAQGLNMLMDHAQFEDGSVSVEAGLMGMLSRMQSGQFKVFDHLNDWWDEFRLYHRKDGKVVKEGDDLMSATRYAVMMLRFASTKAAYDNFRRKIVYPKISIA